MRKRQLLSAVVGDHVGPWRFQNFLKDRQSLHGQNSCNLDYTRWPTSLDCLNHDEFVKAIRRQTLSIACRGTPVSQRRGPVGG